MFESRISVRAKENYLPELQGNVMQKQYLLGRSCKEMREKILRFANKTSKQFFKVATPCMDDYHFKEQENGSVGDWSCFSTDCSDMPLFGTCW